ncbi:MAG: hypothetical protein J0H82_18730 [Alphaproteobacteria bacterium]|jgi:hypothetical protein|nr:hypothetical protein [Alphaproteobacteria bacterium]
MKPWSPFPDLVELVAVRHQVSAASLLGRPRDAKLVRARWELVWLATRLTGESVTSVARRMGRDHTTLLHGLDRLRHRLRTNRDYAADLAQFEEEVGDALLLPPVDFGPVTKARRRLAAQAAAATTVMLDRIIAAMATDPLDTIARINRALDPEGRAHAPRPARPVQHHNGAADPAAPVSSRHAV